MPHVSIRVTDTEKDWMESYAKLQGASLSDAIKDIFFERLEDEYDLKSIREYEVSPGCELYTLEQVKEELGLDDDL